MPSAFILDRSSVTQVMGWVLAALLPGIVAYVWLFGPGILVTLTLASATAHYAEHIHAMPPPPSKETS